MLGTEAAGSAPTLGLGPTHPKTHEINRYEHVNPTIDVSDRFLFLSQHNHAQTDNLEIGYSQGWRTR